MPEFVEFKKIPRLTRECVVTEKIDGTNGCIYIGEDGEFLVGSKSRWLDEHNENFGFWHWATDNKQELLKLGPGTHYGEWWGNGIQRGYGLLKGDKRFSLFNTGRWVKKIGDNTPALLDKQEYCPECCQVVPILGITTFDTYVIDMFLSVLKDHGSYAVPGFMKPEGIVVFHKAGNLLFKKTVEKDDVPKGSQETK
jgi:hypothetical protein